MAISLIRHVETGKDLWQVTYHTFSKDRAPNCREYKGIRKDAMALERAIVKAYARINARVAEIKE